MARPTRSVKISSRRIQLPDALWKALDELCLNPLTEKPQYGAMTRMMERIVKTDLRRLEKFSEMLNALDIEDKKDDRN